MIRYTEPSHSEIYAGREIPGPVREFWQWPWPVEYALGASGWIQTGMSTWPTGAMTASRSSRLRVSGSPVLGNPAAVSASSTARAVCCVDRDGDIYIADRQNDRVQVLAPNGRFIARLTGDHQLSKWGKEKLLSNPDMIRQRALAIAHDQGAFEKSFLAPGGREG